jgi:hypothetical protein
VAGHPGDGALKRLLCGKCLFVLCAGRQNKADKNELDKW